MVTQECWKIVFSGGEKKEQRMKASSVIFVLLYFILSLPAFAQEEKHHEPQDTALMLLRMKNPELLLDDPIVILPLTFAFAKPEQNMQMPLYLTFAGTPQSFAWENSTTTDLTAPLKLQLYQSESEKAFRITLGAASAGGAAYLAYRYLKKYGLK
ncbi:MAG: hypothetical protein Q8L88_04455 [Bacteroidota bacterium]|nr:hypothetical protein [Bacteroidota bacterium]